MLFPRDDYDLLKDDERLPANTYVALGCPHPDCNWVSDRSRTLSEGTIEVVLAYRAVEDQWERHWADNHQPEPIRLLATSAPTESNDNA